MNLRGEVLGSATGGILRFNYGLCGKFIRSQLRWNRLMEVSVVMGLDE
jgi:hypothetical protein